MKKKNTENQTWLEATTDSLVEQGYVFERDINESFECVFKKLTKDGESVYLLELSERIYNEHEYQARLAEKKRKEEECKIWNDDTPLHQAARSNIMNGYYFHSSYVKFDDTTRLAYLFVSPTYDDTHILWEGDPDPNNMGYDSLNNFGKKLRAKDRLATARTPFSPKIDCEKHAGLIQSDAVQQPNAAELSKVLDHLSEQGFKPCIRFTDSNGRPLAYVLLNEQHQATIIKYSDLQVYNVAQFADKFPDDVVSIISNIGVKDCLTDEIRNILNAKSKFGPTDNEKTLKVGDAVYLQYHDSNNNGDDGSMNYHPEQYSYCDVKAKIISIDGIDPYGAVVGTVDVDDGKFLYRLRDMTDINSCIVSGLNVGDKVILGRHENDDDWTSDMNAYIGKETTITRLRINQYSEHEYANVAIDDEAYQWRTANMTRAEEGLAYVKTDGIDDSIKENPQGPKEMGTPNNAELTAALANLIKGTDAAKGPEKPVEVAREGEKIILPTGMSYEEGIKWLERRRREDEEEVQIEEAIDTFIFDGAHALVQCLKAKYGWTNLVPTPGFFGPQPPAMIGVSISSKETIQIPWGRMQIPNVKGYIETGYGIKDNRFIFRLTGVVKQKHKQEIADLAAMIREYVKTNSIYRGKALRVRFDQDVRKVGPEGSAPMFLDLSAVNIDDLVLPKETMASVQASLFTPITKSQMCRINGINLKRGILLEGKYGTGKTLTADVAAKLCTQNGWTFIYLEKVANLQQALYFAQQYQPAVVFAEDIDREVNGERTEDMDAILNTIDGVDTKHAEIITVLTTNHVDDINPAMMRPGRLDAIISIAPPDPETVEILIRKFAGNLLPGNENIRSVCKILNGQIPAIIKEAVVRAKLYAIARLEPGSTVAINATDLEMSGRAMIDHVKFMDAEEMSSPDQEALDHMATVLGGYLMRGVKEASLQLLTGTAKELPMNGDTVETAMADNRG